MSELPVDEFEAALKRWMGKNPLPLLDESDRQAILLALAVLALQRPGWDTYLGEIAKRFHGREMWRQFKTYNADRVPRRKRWFSRRGPR